MFLTPNDVREGGTKKKYLPGYASGDIITAIALTEPGAGSDLASMLATAVETDGTVTINGSKTFISNDINCDLLILAAKYPDVENPYHAVSLYRIEDRTPGFERGTHLDTMGMHSQDRAELFFNDCRIPSANRLGARGNGCRIEAQVPHSVDGLKKRYGVGPTAGRTLDFAQMIDKGHCGRIFPIVRIYDQRAKSVTDIRPFIPVPASVSNPAGKMLILFHDGVPFHA